MEDLDHSGYSLLQEAVEDHEPFDFSVFDTEPVHHGADKLASHHHEGVKQVHQRIMGADPAALDTQDEGLRNLRASLTGDSATTGHQGPAFLSHLDTSGHLEPSLLEDLFHNESEPPQQQAPAAQLAPASIGGLPVHSGQQQPLALQPQTSFHGTLASPALAHQLLPGYPMQHLQLAPNMEASTRSMAPLSRSPSAVSESPHAGGGGGGSSFKPRLRWTDELHDKFLEAIVNLGGYQEATPSGILKAMGVDRLELSHVKSHLQKYRSEKKRTMEKDDDDKEQSKKKPKAEPGASGSKAKPPSGAAKPKPKRESSLGKPTSPRKADAGARGKTSLLEVAQQQQQHHQQQQQQQMNSSTDSSGRVLEAALRKQFELQQMLSEQLEAQKKLQSSLEQHTKYISWLMQDKYQSGSEADATFLPLDTSDINSEQQQQQQHQ